MAEIESIISALRADNASVTVLLAKLIPTSNVTHNSAIDAINARIDAIAASLSTASSPVIVVDQNSGFDASLDTYDGIHPNESGEAKMAQAWFGPLVATLKGRPSPASDAGQPSAKERAALKR